MALAAPASSSALHLNFPPSTSAGGVLHSRSLTGVGVHPVALFSILDHYLRRSDAAAAAAEASTTAAVRGGGGSSSAAPAAATAAPSTTAEDDAERRTDPSTTASKAGKKETAPTAATPTPAPAPTHVRVIGTLLGIRTDSEIEIRSSFAIPHKETEEQVEVDIEYHRKMAELHAKTHPGEVIVGWYATGAELNTYSALIQDLFSKETGPHQAVHLTFDTDLSAAAEGGKEGQGEGDALGVRAYISSPLGLVPKPENAVFLPLPVTLLQAPAERPALNLLAQTASAAAQSGSASSEQSQAQQQQSTGPVSDMLALTRALYQVQEQLDRVLLYVRDVLDNKRPGSAAVGRYLLDTVAMAPGGIAPEKLEGLFNGHLQDVLMISYLANVVRAQAEVSTRLNLLT
ncbi:unnamed protein product [Tilletia controversa]|uniref:Eukaryotic translation initiation factor 3 subunit F n=3 Tax=Tilletia TaxID=13289 RepID=A0A8X7MYB4_9BASI|nr:hypothetical protein CF336_g8386 [Tilletia laevis]KAE8204172.1 hypothetical protein CF328_g1225 [Tilletia controversa]KAE8256854.1 hypothetical protein A4X03_0g4991 [Tilletia caries]KAE8199693.1 hypothetical protein CF335_g4115 [Tilletia laevis]KAE8253503.1 hypothetical protein A4X06_0g1407 [Tilletia controversa]